MSSSAIQEILKETEELLALAGDLVPAVELAVEKLGLPDSAWPRGWQASIPATQLRRRRS